ncbi:two component transcriptional regulator, LuxR family [Arthrobacter sp. ok909]|uniref:response regulator transcription factor n=1 Tax=Arthrobacter sp. ok909 TaxID=1761746 RepID=UPI00088C2B81|nr:response regulator transcription factor [Arthrobacter sp. ok909]SDP44200.1 two component transcriptional regulator, LuxR family [Arthrobacter sp. ok909]
MGVPLDTVVARERSPGPVCVFVVIHHELARQGLRVVLEEAGLEVVGDCWSAAQAGRRIVDAGTDVAVLDGLLPDGTGIEVCRVARSVDADLQCLLMTSYVDDEVLRGAVLAGAAGYVLREVRGHSLVEAIRRAATGESLLGPAVVERVRAWFATATADRKAVDLTGAEKDVVALILEGLSNRQLSEALGLTETSVCDLVSALLVKLGFGRNIVPTGRPDDAAGRELRIPSRQQTGSLS